MKTDNSENSAHSTQVRVNCALADGDIYSCITKLLYDFEGRTGRKPTAIYLGFDTLKCLKRQLNSALMYQCRLDRSSLGGVAIYEVDCADHLNVG